MARLMELRQQKAFSLAKADSLVKAAESAKRELTPNESMEFDSCMTAVDALNSRIGGIEKTATIRGMQGADGSLFSGAPRMGSTTEQRVVLSEDYPSAFAAYIASAGKNMSAALYEGSNSAGGFAIPVVVSDQIVPLAPAEQAVRRLAQVIPTTSDIKVPQ